MGNVNYENMTPGELAASVGRGNVICATELKPLDKEGDFRFPLATVNVANRQSFPDAVRFAMHNCKAPERNSMKDAEAWVSHLVKKSRETNRD